VPATFEGRPGLFVLDTGGDGTLVLSAPTVARFNMLQGRDATATDVIGISGPARVRGGKLASFRLADREFGPLPAAFATTNSGAFADPYVDGVIGVGILREFV